MAERRTLGSEWRKSRAITLTPSDAITFSTFSLSLFSLKTKNKTNKTNPSSYCPRDGSSSIQPGTVCEGSAAPTFWSPQHRISSKCCPVRAAQRDASFPSPGAKEKTVREKKQKWMKNSPPPPHPQKNTHTPHHPPNLSLYISFFFTKRKSNLMKMQ